jgi:hypothetical protein
LKSAAALLAATLVALSACAPLPQDNAAADAAAAASAASAAQAASAAVPATPPGPPGEQRVTVGGGNGYRVTIKVMPPSQVCDNDAFVEGVRYGYAATWNRLLAEAVRESGVRPAGKRRFDPATIRLKDDEYKIEWNGKERVNACASDGYLIGRIVGTHLASVDLRKAKAS